MRIPWMLIMCLLQKLAQEYKQRIFVIFVIKDISFEILRGHPFKIIKHIQVCKELRKANVKEERRDVEDG